MLVDTAATPILIRALFREPETRFYYIRSVVKNVNNNVILFSSEDKYHVKVSNPCLYANQVAAKAITGFSNYWIKDATATETITPFLDWTTTTYGNIDRTALGFP